MMNELKNTLDNVNNLQRTENGALGYSTTGNKLVDLNFRVPSNHKNVSVKDVEDFIESFNENPVDTIKWLFYLRDIREGLGERDSFVRLFMTLHSKNIHLALRVLPLIPEYGRWKDIIDILDHVGDDCSLACNIYDMISIQLKQDCSNMMNGKAISLLAKWMPSVNASKKARKLALRLCRNIELYPESYRKMLAKLRKYIDVTEIKTCGGKWGEIDYNKVSSNANARYLIAFVKHDEKRRQEYLDSLKKGEMGVRMNAKNLYPHEVYAKYSYRNSPRTPTLADDGIEALWNNLKQMPSVGNTLVVVDGSGSMGNHIKGSSIQAIDVSRSLGVYFAERTEGEFHNKTIEFSSNPHFIDLTKCETLADKINVMKQHNDCSNTNLQKVFDLVLKTAVDNKLPQSELPDRFLIVSDMEFDCACEYSTWNDAYDSVMRHYATLFETIKRTWDAAGYKMPQVVFWNVNSRTQTAPVGVNECGVILVSGFSQNAIKAVLTGNDNSWSALKEILDSPRYDKVAEAIA